MTDDEPGDDAVAKVLFAAGLISLGIGAVVGRRRGRDQDRDQPRETARVEALEVADAQP